MKPYIEKYEQQIEGELFKATPDEAIEFADGLIKFLLEVKANAIQEKEANE